MVHTQVAATPDIRTSLLNPHTKVSPTETSIKEIFAREFNILAFALGIYHLDAQMRLSKQAIMEHLASGVALCEENLAVAFDLENIDFRRKGFTRYYPFKAGGKNFIIRIFDRNERHYLPDFAIFYEGVFEESNLGFQILPGINAILKAAKAEKITLQDPNRYAASP